MGRVEPVFRDHRDVVAPRDHRGYGSTWYTDDSGRNDIVTCRVGRDAEYLYFYVETVDDISPPSDKWMMLLLDIDRDKSTGWEGYDFVVNRKAPRDGKAILEKCVGRWKWNEVAGLDFNVNGKRLELRIPKQSTRTSRRLSTASNSSGRIICKQMGTSWTSTSMGMRPHQDGLTITIRNTSRSTITTH